MKFDVFTKLIINKITRIIFLRNVRIRHIRLEKFMPVFQKEAESYISSKYQ